jgi:hypothetical protein
MGGALGGEGVAAGADLDGAVSAGRADELLDRPAPVRCSINRVTARSAKT